MENCIADVVKCYNCHTVINVNNDDIHEGYYVICPECGEHIVILYNKYITQEEKDLLIKDLCSRISYKVKCQIYGVPQPLTLSGIIPSRAYQELYFEEMDYKECDGFVDIKRSYCKPYLFPLSSMTEEQRKELFYLSGIDIINGKFYTNNEFTLEETLSGINWLYKNYFDVNGLIPLGLAKDATELNIY